MFDMNVIVLVLSLQRGIELVLLRVQIPVVCSAKYTLEA
jgi:hypothetical protein